MMTLEEARRILHPDTTWDNIRELTADGVAPAETIEQACIVACEAIDKVLASRWISVKDRLPEEDIEVLVCTKSKNGSRNIDKGYRIGERFAHRGTAEVTHWMPLPEPPEEDGE